MNCERDFVLLESVVSLPSSAVHKSAELKLAEVRSGGIGRYCAFATYMVQVVAASAAGSIIGGSALQRSVWAA